VPVDADALAGIYTATVSVTDDDGGVGSTETQVAVNFETSGFLPPLNTSGSNEFKFKSTIPVKIRFIDCDGSKPTGLAPTIKLTLLSGPDAGLEIIDPASTSDAETVGILRYGPGHYISNLAAESLPDTYGTYQITITIPHNGQVFTINFTLRP